MISDTDASSQPVACEKADNLSDDGNEDEESKENLKKLIQQVNILAITFFLKPVLSQVVFFFTSQISNNSTITENNLISLWKSI